MKTCVVVDTSAMIFRCLYKAIKDDENFIVDESYGLFKFYFFDTILEYIIKFNPDTFIMAMDCKDGYWRKQMYPEYKGQRKADREASKIDFDKFFPYVANFMEDIKSVFTNIYFLRVSKCEADDIAGVLTPAFKNSYKIVAVATDGDWYQNYMYPNYVQFHPIKKQFIECLNPKTLLETKILTGDSGDNIPAVKPRCGPATALKMLSDLAVHLENDTIRENYIRNKKLIAFSEIPEEYKLAILEDLCAYELTKCKSMDIMKFMARHKQNKFVQEAELYTKALNRLGPIEM